MNKELYGDSYGEQFRKYEERTVELEKKLKGYKKQIYLKEKALARIKRDNENLLDQNAMYEFFYEGNGFYKRGLNNSIMIAEYIEKLEKENADKKDQLIKAKEIIKKLMIFAEIDLREIEPEYKEAEQFLKENDDGL